MSEPIAVAVVAKACLPGKVKTRLTPPLTPEQAARLAQAALDDTLDAVRSVPARRRILFWEGESVRAPGFEVLPQPRGTLDERLGSLLDDIDEPLVFVGMDTPQLTPSALEGPLRRWPDDLDAWIGVAPDGGFWAMALREPDGGLVRGVEMSRADTAARQAARLGARGLHVGRLEPMRDVDTVADARIVAHQAAGTRFARMWRGIAEEGGYA